MKKTIIAFLAIGLTACASYKIVAPSKTDVEHGSAKYPGLTLADLTEGKTIFESNCVKCHSPQRPFRVSAAEVEKIMPKMAKKAGIDSRKSELVLKYLITMKGTAKKYYSIRI